jgi:phage tail-like protein
MARKYNKSTFVNAVELITPDVYLEDDYSACGIQLKDTDELINSHILSLEKLSSTVDPSNISTSNRFSAIGSIQGFSQFFIKQNKTTNITTESFQEKILTPLGKKISSFDSSSDFGNYVSGTLLPLIHLKSATIITDTSGLFGNTLDGITEYLLENLSWLYLLNKSGPVLSPSAIVASSIATKLYTNTPYTTADGVKDYQKYLWHNYSSFSGLDSRIIPERFTSGTGSYTSGNQNLEKLETLIDVVYSPLEIDKDDTTVEDAFNTYITNSTLLKNTEYLGPFSKFLRAISYSFYDVNNQVESIGDLMSIDDCPAEYLPLLANLVGWKLYGKNEQSWRNQIRSAATLYRKKGTKQGLVEAFNTIITQNPINTSATVVELYESYLPNLLYYLLKTESSLFSSTSDLNKKKAIGLGIDNYSPTDIDHNIRSAVDSIILGAVKEFPHLFSIRNEPFRVNVLENGKAWFGEVAQYESGDYYTATRNEFGELGIDFDTAIKVEFLGDPAFVFNYRGRDLPIPPWDNEKFYQNCAITNQLLNYYISKLKDYCVNSSYADKLRNYVYNYTISANLTSDLYSDNGYLFFTSSHQDPPNMEAMLKRYDDKNYDSLSLWNGKSSTFDFSVCAGPFVSDLFADVSATHTVNEIFESLQMVHEFSPAKAIPRVRASKFAVESASGYENFCLNIGIPFQDVFVSGASGTNIGGGMIAGSGTAMNNFYFSGEYVRGTGRSCGNDFTWSLGYDDSRSTVSHAFLPVFKREASTYVFEKAESVVRITDTVPATSAIPRASTRRRNFTNALTKNGWYDRSGKNMPTFNNNASGLFTRPDAFSVPSVSGMMTDFVPLGFNPSSYDFAPATDENLSGVYRLADCSSVSSTDSFFGNETSGTFSCRGMSNLSVSSCDPYVRRDSLPEEVMLFFHLEEKRKEAIANYIVNQNQDYFAANRLFSNPVGTLVNTMEDSTYDKYLSPNLDIRKNGSVTTRPAKGVHQIYKDFTNYFSGTAGNEGLPEGLLTSYLDGGPNILSHVYGPIYYNSNLSIDGSGVDTSSQLVSNSLEKPYVINLGLSAADLGAISVSKLGSTQVSIGKDDEVSTKFILSGISMIDASSTPSPKNEFIIFDLEEKEERLYDKRYLVGNRNVLMRNRTNRLARLRYALRANTDKNILIPNCDYQLSLDYLTGKDSSNDIGAFNSLGVLIHTKAEYISETGEYGLFIWTPKAKWEYVDLSALQTVGAVNNVLTNYTHTFTDERIEVEDVVSKCGDDLSVPSLYSIDKDSYTKATINFHTKNNLTDIPLQYKTNLINTVALSATYNGRDVIPHRASLSDNNATQNYFINVFAYPQESNSDDFVLLDELSLVNKTLNDAARIPYDACVPDIEPSRNPVSEPTLFKEDGTELLPKDSKSVIVDLETGDPRPSIIKTSTECANNVDDVVSWDNINPNSWQGLGWRLQHDPGGLFDLAANFGSTDHETRFDMPMLPYTGCTVQTYTQNALGWDSVFNPQILSRPGWFLNSGYWNQNTGGFGGYSNLWEADPNYTWLDGLRSLQAYFAANSADLTDCGQNGPGGSWASPGKWSNLIFNGFLIPGENSAWGSGDHIGTVGTSLVTDKYGLLTGVSPMGDSTSTECRREDHTDYIKNPLGYTRMDDLSEALPSVYRDIFPVGVPQPLCFLSRRYNPELENQGVLQRDRWINIIQDPSGVMDTDEMVQNHVNFFGINGISIENSLLGSTFYTKFGRPQPHSIYQDTKHDKLVDGEYYTFQVYLGQVPEGGSYKGWGTTGAQRYGGFGQPVQPDHHPGSLSATNATSGIITILPTDSSSTYARLTVNFETDTSSIEKAGGAGSLADAVVARCQTIEVEQPGIPYPYHTTKWYKMEVTVPWDSQEFDRNFHETTQVPAAPGLPGSENRPPNFGLRCVIQAYNDKLDGNLVENPANPEFPIDMPSLIQTWGPSLTRSSTGPTWYRSMQTFANPEYPNPNPDPYLDGIIYTASGNLIDTVEYDLVKDRVLVADDTGLLKYLDADTSSLKKVTVGIPNDGDAIKPTKLISKPRYYDSSNVLASGVNFIFNDAKKVVHNGNTLQVSSGEEGTNMVRCVQGTTAIAPKELLHLFRYFNHIGQSTRGSGFNSRVSGGAPERTAAFPMGSPLEIHASAGGSRLSYRTHPDDRNLGSSGSDHGNFTAIQVVN